MSELQRNRLIGAVVCAVTLAPLLVAARLAPASEGMGTHEQLGLPPCGFYQVTHLPCATCGMTTSFAYATHGDLLTALLTQPAGLLVCLACAVCAMIGAWAAWSGMSLKPIGGVINRPMVIFAGLGVVLLSWGYNIWAHLG